MPKPTHPCLFDSKYNCSSSQCSGEWCPVYVMRDIDDDIYSLLEGMNELKGRE